MPKLGDFGIAKLRDKVDPFGHTLRAWHTPPYVPPDNSVGYEFTRDVWAVAVVFIEAMSTSRVLDYPDIQKQLHEIDVPSEIRNLLQRCVDSDPELRPQNASVFLKDLSGIQGLRRARRVRAEASLWLELSKRAVAELAGVESTPDRQIAQSVATSDLINQIHAEFRFDPEQQALDRETIFLYGSEWRFVLKMSQSGHSFVVVGARKADSALDRKKRADACPVGELFGICFWDPGPTRSTLAAEALHERLDNHYAALAIKREEERLLKVENALFDRYLDLLDAREELDRGDRRPISYSARDVRGKEVEFTFRAPVEHDYTGQEWDIRIGNGRMLARGEFLRQSGEKAVLRFRRLPKNLPTSGELTPFLGPGQRAHERQVEAVKVIRDGSGPRPDLRELLVDPSRIRRPDPALPERWLQENLDRDKRSAVASALGAKDFVLVEGPPGTGKTSFITETVAQHLLTNPSAQILIVSQTHVAVDNALERLEAAGLTRLVRLGKPEDPRVSVTVKHLLLDNQMREWAINVERRAERYMANLAEAQGLSIRHLKAALALQRLRLVIGDIAHLESRISDGDVSRDTVTGVEQLRDRVDVQERLDFLREQSLELRQEAQLHLESDLTLPDELDKDSAGAAAEALLGSSPANAKLLMLVKLQGEWIQRVSSDRKLVNAFLQTTSVLAGTCVGFLGHPAVRDLEFDLCILDEASKATATEALVPLARAKKWILVGDTRQLPPMDEEVLRNRALMQSHGLDEDFVTSTLFDRLVAGTAPPVRHLLRQQYRMIRPIGDLISACFYGGGLVSPISDGVPGLDLLGKPALWISTSRLGKERFEEQFESGTKSRLNRVEARVVIKRLKDIDTAIDKQFVKPGRTLSVLLISPYRLQIEELERRLATYRPKNLEVDVLSVDAVQGREADIGIFSVTRSNPRGDLGFLGESYWRRINVALSRARFSLTIVGDMEFCLSQPGALRDVSLHMRANPLDCEIRELDHA
ncbi:AAA domain-containing protein [Kribbella sp. VKM Ac-2571]|nr:AAA domain-containing protein [Kribbella sp. VKM Ac-2571]